MQTTMQKFNFPRLFLAIFTVISLLLLPLSTQAAGFISQTSGTSANLNAVSFSTPTNGLAAGEGGVIRKTLNSGFTWTTTSSGTTTNLNDIFIVPGTSITYTVGNSGVIRKSIDLGASWSSQTSGTLSHLIAVHFSTATNGLAVGDDGTIRKTTNGSTWITSTSDTVAVLNDIFIIPGTSIAYTVGNGGVIRKTSDLGTSWSGQISGSSANLNGVYFSDTLNGWAVGNSGTIRHTVNAGGTWTTQPSGTGAHLYGVYFADALNGWVVGDDGVVRKTTDGGNTWNGVLSGTASPLFDLAFPSANDGWAVGTSGTIRHYDATPPTVSAVSPTTATAGTATTLNTIYSDPSGITLCSMYWSNGGLLGAMTLSAPGGTNGTATVSYTFPSAGTYSMGPSCRDGAGNFNGPGTYTTITVSAPPDTIAPTAPTGVTRTSAASDTTPTFTWTASTDNVGVTNYQVQIQNSMENNVISATDLGNVLTYTVPDGSALSTGSYTFLISAQDAAGNSSSPFTTFGFTISAPANIPPNVPAELAQRDVYNGADLPVGYVDNDGAIIFKARLSDPDASQTIQLQVEIKAVGTSFSGVPTNSSQAVANNGIAQVQLPSASGSHHWQARAIDSIGAVSGWVSFGGNSESAADFVVSINVPPSAPTSLSQFTSLNGSNLSVGATDNDGNIVFGAESISDSDSGQAVSLEVELRLVGTAFSNTPTHASSMVTSGVPIRLPASGIANGSYHWQARAKDFANATSSWISFGSNSESAADFIIFVPAGDTTAPSAPANVVRTSTETDTTPTFTWDAATDTSGISFYDINIDGTGWRSIDLVTSWTVAAEDAFIQGTTHTLQVRAADNSSNRNLGPAASLTFTITASVPDTTPPLTPSGLTRTTTDSNNTPTFTWNAATDNVAVTSYEYQLDGGGFQSTGTALSVTLSATSIGSHTFAVRARDAAGNISATAALSFTISAPSTSADTTAPSAPTGLTRTTPNTNTTPAFSWTASTDAVGVTEYEVQTNAGTFISVGTALTYTSPSALAIGTHTFGLRARDGAGNISGVSALSFTISAPAGTSSNAGTNSSSANSTSTGGATGTSSGSGTSVAPNRPPFTLDQMLVDAQTIVQGDIAALLPTLGVSNAMLCQMDPIAAALKVEKVFPTVTDPTMHAALNHFTSCGTVTTLHLGAGERLGVVNSYKSAFGRLPSTAAHWFDVIKLANGRFPGETSATTEGGAKARFNVIYKRAPNTSQPNDSAAVTIMAYGMRPLPRNVASEAAAINIYKKIFGGTPLTAPQWDALRAIAYSGATR